MSADITNKTKLCVISWFCRFFFMSIMWMFVWIHKISRYNSLKFPVNVCVRTDVARLFHLTPLKIILSERYDDDIHFLRDIQRCLYFQRTEEQKLIYSGQLLHDTVVLKDVLRKYEGQDTHTVHLVFTPKYNGTIMKESEKKKSVTSSSVNRPVSTQQSASSSSTVGSNANTDGIRHRTTTTTNSGQPAVVQQQQQQPVNPFFNPNMLYAMQAPLNVAATTTQNPNSPDYLAAQQAAMQTWMQQAYAQYFNQYMNM